MYEGALIAYGGQVRAFRDFCRVQLCFDVVCSDVDVVVVLQRQLHGLMQSNVASGSGIAWLSSKGHGPGEQEGD
jgi:hypothetical protein